MSLSMLHNQQQQKIGVFLAVSFPKKFKKVPQWETVLPGSRTPKSPIFFYPFSNILWNRQKIAKFEPFFKKRPNRQIFFFIAKRFWISPKTRKVGDKIANVATLVRERKNQGLKKPRIKKHNKKKIAWRGQICHLAVNAARFDISGWISRCLAVS